MAEDFPVMSEDIDEEMGEEMAEEIGGEDDGYGDDDFEDETETPKAGKPSPLKDPPKAPAHTNRP